mgnify:CR=1|jgi:hypothetical protein
MRAMTTYLFFDEALRIFVNAFLISVLILIVVSAIGLAIVGSIEKNNIYPASPKHFR